MGGLGLFMMGLIVGERAMTCEELDRELAGRNQQLAAVANNLMELQADATYQLLTGSGGATRLQLRGETAARVLPALAEMETLFQQFGLLQAWLERVAQMRRDLRPVFGREQALKEIEAVLRGESIRLPETALPLSQRNLLSGLERARGVRPDDLLARMVEAFAKARDAVLMVGEVWEQVLVEVEAAEAELRALRGQVAGAAVPREIGAAEALLEGVKAGVECDPLGARGELRGKLRPSLAALAGRVRLRVQVQQEMLAAEAMLRRLLELEEEIGVAGKNSFERIAGAVAEVDARGEVEGLRVWLERLKQRCEEERPEAIGVGLRNWQRAADGLVQRETDKLRRVSLPLEMRRELRGRMEALKAKARAYGMAENVVMAELAAEAEALLYARPTDVARAAAAVGMYEQKLSGARMLKTAGEQRR